MRGERRREPRDDRGPPAWARAWLARILPEDEREPVLGEMDELWRTRVREQGPRTARWWYRRQVAGFTLRGWRLRRLTRSGTTTREGTMGGFGGILADVRWAVRALRRRPTFTAVAVATLALGIGANTAVLTLAKAHFLTPLPYDEPDDVVLLWETSRNSDEVTTVAPGNYFIWREEARSFSDVAAFNVDLATLSGDGAAERVRASTVTPSFFSVLGVRPAVGTLFDERAVAAADGLLVVLSHGLWTRRYGADPSVVGREIRVDGRPYTVTGILPAEYRQPEQSLEWQAPELWRPLLLEARRSDFGSRYLRAVARLAPGVTPERARDEMSALAERMEARQPVANAGRRIQVWTLDDYLMGDARPVLLLLLVAGLAVLLIVCANVANLTLARGRERAREFAVRAALGSGRGRLMRQVVVESVVLSLVGGAVGALLVWVAEPLLQAVQQRFFTSLVPAEADFVVLAGTTLMALVSGLLFGLPLARSAGATDLRAGVSEGGARQGRSAGLAESLLIVGQVGCATTLVVVALLLTRSFNTLVAVPPGFEPDGLLTLRVGAPTASYEGREDVEGYFRSAWSALEGIPGIGRVAMSTDLPFEGENRWMSFEVEGLPYDPTDPPRAEYRTVSSGYLEVMGIPFRAGSFPQDTWAAFEDEIPVAVNERMAALFWPERDPLGRRFTASGGSGRPYRVAAVVGNVLDDGYGAQPEPLFYRPWGAVPQRSMAFVVETTGFGSAMAEGVRTALRSIDPDIPVSDLRTLDDLIQETVVRPRAASFIGGLFALAALLVAAAGIFGVLSYIVQRRTSEIGIRAALGASTRQILRLVMGHATRLLAAGLVLGVAGALITGRALSALLFDVRPWDPLSYSVAVTVLLAVGFLAAWLPARRAVRVDPRQALRAE